MILSFNMEKGCRSSFNFVPVSDPAKLVPKLQVQRIKSTKAKIIVRMCKIPLRCSSGWRFK